MIEGKLLNSIELKALSLVLRMLNSPNLKNNYMPGKRISNNRYKSPLGRIFTTKEAREKVKSNIKNKKDK